MRIKKFLIAILSVCFVATSALAIASCDKTDGETSEPTKMGQIYAQYLVYAQAEGVTPLSYEDWLDTVKGEKGEKGDKGDKGETGATGEKGEDGKSAYQIWLDNGNTGSQADFLDWLKGETGKQGETGATGATGATGKSAYDIWLEAGNEGDEQAFLDWLKGETGKQGETGVGIEKVEYDENGDLKITYTNGNSETIVLPDKHVHTFGKWISFTTDDVVCENRIFYHICSSCNGIEWKNGSYNDHDWEIVTTDPTCQEQGFDTKTCKVCNKVEFENYTETVDHAWATKYSFNSRWWKSSVPVSKGSLKAQKSHCSAARVP